MSHRIIAFPRSLLPVLKQWMIELNLLHRVSVEFVQAMLFENGGLLVLGSPLALLRAMAGDRRLLDFCEDIEHTGVLARVLHRYKLYAICALMYLCSTMNGYDGSLMASINAIPEYQQYYDLGPDGAATTGLIFSIWQVGQIAAAPMLWIPDWLGRRIPISLGCLGVILSAIATSLAADLHVFIAGRFFLSFFAMVAYSSSPVYLVEIVPPERRATLAGTYNTWYFLGSIVATSAAYGANMHFGGDLKWRFPLWLQVVCPAVVCVGVLFVPESPRWLIAKGRYEEARNILMILRASKNDRTDLERFQLIDREMIAIKQSLTSQSITTPRDMYNLNVLYKTRSRRYRLFLVVAFAWFGQFSGNNVTSYYLPLMLKDLNIVQTDLLLLFNAVYSVIGWAFAVAGAHFHDIWGRRPLLISGCAGMVACLSVIAGSAASYVQTASGSASRACVASVFVFGAVFAFTITPMQPIYPVEVLSNDMRAKGMMVFTLTAGCAGFANTFAAPVGLARIGYWFYVFFILWDVLEGVVIYYFFVETKGFVLEEMERIFEARNPRKASTDPAFGLLPG